MDTIAYRNLQEARRSVNAAMNRSTSPEDRLTTADHLMMRAYVAICDAMYAGYDETPEIRRLVAREIGEMTWIPALVANTRSTCSTSSTLRPIATTFPWPGFMSSAIPRLVRLSSSSWILSRSLS